jgi:hypothetical protein
VTYRVPHALLAPTGPAAAPLLAIVVVASTLHGADAGSCKRSARAIVGDTSERIIYEGGRWDRAKHIEFWECKTAFSAFCFVHVAFESTAALSVDNKSKHLSGLQALCFWLLAPGSWLLDPGY